MKTNRLLIVSLFLIFALACITPAAATPRPAPVTLVPTNTPMPPTATPVPTNTVIPSPTAITDMKGVEAAFTSEADPVRQNLSNCPSPEDLQKQLEQALEANEDVMRLWPARGTFKVEMMLDTSGNAWRQFACLHLVRFWPHSPQDSGNAEKYTENDLIMFLYLARKVDANAYLALAEKDEYGTVAQTVKMEEFSKYANKKFVGVLLYTHSLIAP